MLSYHSIRNTIDFSFDTPGLKKMICPLLFVFSTLCGAQTVPDSIRIDINQLIYDAPKTHADIDVIVKRYRQDSLYMRFFLNRSVEKKYTSGQIFALNQLGIKYRNTTQYGKASKFHEEALNKSKENEHLEFEIFSLNMLGVLHRRIHSLRSAVDYHQAALQLAEGVENPPNGIKRSINVALNGIGNLYQALGEYDNAIAQYRKSLQLEASLDNKLGLAINHQNIGECLEKDNRLQEALTSYRTSLAYNEEIDNDMGRSICYNSIGQIYIKQQRSIEAVSLFKKALVKAEKLNDDFLIEPAKINLGWARLMLDQDKEAELLLLKGLESATKHDRFDSAIKASNLLSQLKQKATDYKTALYYEEQEQLFKEEKSTRGMVDYLDKTVYDYELEKQNNELIRLKQKDQRREDELERTKDTMIFGAIALALLAGILYILYRQYHLNNEKKLLTLEQSMLRSQMNPHFLFNSLNSIKLYIINNEKKNAVHYLNKFSKLVRKILEASSLKEIPLAEELDTVELYMNIENIRFSNEINFSITVDNQLDPENIKIPSLILQPFLENALWHGLSPKDGDKSIKLKVEKDSEAFINILITDNGVGRAAAEEIKERKVLKRKSVGIDITKERLANFSKDYQNSFEVTIIDLYDAEQKPSGTQVKLRIPTI